MSEDMSEIMSKERSERMSEDMSERMSKDMSETCQKECQKICRKNVKRYVRKNGKRYVRKNVRRYKDSCLHLVVSIMLIASCFFCFIWRTAASHCSKYCWLNFVFVQGSEWRETSGMWHMKGGLFQMRRASKSWRARCNLSYFGLVLGGWSARVGDKWCAEQSHLHRRSERTTVASVGLHGLHTPWDVVVAPKPFCMFGLNCCLAGRSDACGVCVCGTTGVLHLWT